MSHRVRGSGAAEALRLLRQVRHRAELFAAGPPDPVTDRPIGARASRVALWMDGLFSNASESFVSGFVSQFALAFGASNFHIGMLGAVTSAGAALGLLPGARLADHFGRRQPIVIITSGLLARLLLLALVVLPVIVGKPDIVYAIIAVMAARAFFAQLGFPAWSSLLADIVPASIRGRYFASRNIGIGLAALLAAPLAGEIIGIGGVPGGYQASFSLAAALGLVATYFFSRIREPATAPRNRSGRRPAASWLAILRGHPRFRSFIVVASVWNLALMVAGPFFVVHQVRNLHATPFQIGLISATNAVVNILMQRVWGRLTDRRGAAWVMRLTGMLIPLVPLLWAIAPRWYWLVPVEILSGLLWSGYSPSVFNLMLELAPAAQRPRFAAIYQLVVSVASFFGPLLGSLLADHIAIPGLFVVSAAGRWIAAGLFLLGTRPAKGILIRTQDGGEGAQLG